MSEQIINQKEFKKLMKSLHTFTERVQKNVIVGAIRAGAGVVRDEMKNKVPRDSGALKKAIYIKKRKTSKDKVKFSATIRRKEVANGSGLKTTTQYAYYLEYGTRSMPARPFIRPALASVGNRPLEASRRYFKPRMEKEKKKLGFK